MFSSLCSVKPRCKKVALFSESARKLPLFSESNYTIPIGSKNAENKEEDLLGGLTPWWPKDQVNDARQTRRSRSSTRNRSSGDSVSVQDETPSSDRKSTADKGPVPSPVRKVTWAPTLQTGEERRARSSSRKRKPAPPMKYYPKSTSDFHSMLDNSSRVFPANLPAVINECYSPVRDSDDRNQIDVRSGMIVNALYKHGGWICLQTSQDNFGFVPAHIVFPIGAVSTNVGVSRAYDRHSHTLKRNERGPQTPEVLTPRRSRSCQRRQRRDSVNSSDQSRDHSDECYFSDDNIEVTSSVTGQQPSLQKGHDLIVLYEFLTTNPNGVSVHPEEVVSLVKADHPGWLCVRKRDGRAGYIPRAYTTVPPRAPDSHRVTPV